MKKQSNLRLNWRDLEGFEPPTLRSEVLSNPQQHVLAWNRSRVFQAFPAFYFMSVRLGTSHRGNIHGNNLGGEPQRDEIERDRQPRPHRSIKKPHTLRYLLWCLQKVFFFSTAYPPCFHDVSVLNAADKGHHPFSIKSSARR